MHNTGVIHIGCCIRHINESLTNTRKFKLSIWLASHCSLNNFYIDCSAFLGHWYKQHCLYEVAVLNPEGPGVARGMGVAGVPRFTGDPSIIRP